MDLVQDSFRPPIVIAEMATGEVAYQLDRLDETMRLIRAFVTKSLSR